MDDTPKQPHSITPTPPVSHTSRLPVLYIFIFAFATLTLVLGMSLSGAGDIGLRTNVVAVHELIGDVFPRKRHTSGHIPSQITLYVKRTITAALRDPVGRRDFALAAEGARIGTKLTSPLPTADGGVDARPPENILDEDLRSGSCWMIDDNHGQVAIKLPEFIFPTHITIDHVPREITADFKQAPRQLVVWGLFEGSGNEQRHMDAIHSFRRSPLSTLGDGPPIRGGSRFLPLVAFEYDIHSDTHIQTFSVDSAIVNSGIYFGALVIEIKSNWGAESTRLYRIRVHGTQVSEV